MTTRSAYSIEQFEERLQKFAHEIPKFKAVHAEIGEDSIRIDFSHTEDGKPKRIRVSGSAKTGKVQKWGDMEWEEQEYWGLTIEPKHYMDSPHATKISGEDEKALEWINRLMAEITPVQRFKLSQLSESRKTRRRKC